MKLLTVFSANDLFFRGMKKKLAFLFMLLSFYAQAQQNAQKIIDNLKSELKTNPDAKRTAFIYSDLTWYYSNISIDSALIYGGKAILESKKLGDSTLIAQVYSDVGAVYFRNGDLQNSKENYLKAYSIRKARKDKKGLAKINNNLANIYLNQQQYKPAMEAFLGALDYFESVNDEPNANIAKGNIGLLLSKLKDYPKAVQYISQVIDFQEKNNLSEGLCTSCLNIGNVYLQMKDTVSALKFYNKSLKHCVLAGNKKGTSSVYNNIGNIKTLQKKNKDAVALYGKAENLRQELNSAIDNASLKLNIAKEYIDIKKFEDSKKILLSIQKVFSDKNSNDKMLVTYKLLVTVYANLNKPDSVSIYADKYADLKERVLETSALKQTSELEAKYQNAKKEKLLLKKEAEAKQKNILLISVSVLAFFILLIGMLLYRQQKLKNNQQEQEFQLKTAIAQIETQNKLQEQRLGISRDLHDNIGAQLTFIISSVDNVKYGFHLENNSLSKKLDSISDFTKSTIIELRDTIWAMNNNQITFEDLRARIFNFIEKAKIATENIHFKFNIDNNLNEIKLTSIQGINIYRTIQEAVNNTIKYADATEICINAKTIEDQIEIEITDNGKGFDPETIDKGNGLFNMQKRIEDIDGVFKIDSDSGKGTTIIIILNSENPTT